jgi:uncharacterized protein with HEPN domain
VIGSILGGLDMQVSIKILPTIKGEAAKRLMEKLDAPLKELDMQVSIKILPTIKGEAAKRLMEKLDAPLKEVQYLHAERQGMKEV